MTSATFFFIFIPILAIILLAVNLIFAPHNPYQEKDSAFECGFHSFLGQNRTQFSISFFIFALLFLLFDLEILLVYPYVVSAYANGIYGLVVMLIFFLALTLGFAFELGKNALKIDSRQTLNTNSFIHSTTYVMPSFIGKTIINDIKTWIDNSYENGVCKEGLNRSDSNINNYMLMIANDIRSKLIDVKLNNYLVIRDIDSQWTLMYKSYNKYSKEYNNDLKELRIAYIFYYIDTDKIVSILLYTFLDIISNRDIHYENNPIKINNKIGDEIFNNAIRGAYKDWQIIGFNKEYLANRNILFNDWVIQYSNRPFVDMFNIYNLYYNRPYSISCGAFFIDVLIELDIIISNNNLLDKLTNANNIDYLDISYKSFTMLTGKC